jgi:uncharacterized protein DUF6394
VLHHPYKLFVAVVVNLIATVLEVGDRTQIGAVQCAQSTSLVAGLQLISAALLYGLRRQGIATMSWASCGREVVAHCANVSANSRHRLQDTCP